MTLAYAGSARPWAIVEIARGCDEAQREALIRAAYQSSRAGPVALALRGVSRQVVDRILDAVVDARNDELKGVLYLEVEAEQELYELAAQASVVIAWSDGLRLALQRRGICAVDVDGAWVALQAAVSPISATSNQA